MEDLILIIDDSPSCQKVATESLKKLAEIKTVSTVEDARLFLTNNRVQLVILDIELPDGDGLEFYCEMQTKLNHPDTPVVVISGNSDICKNGEVDLLLTPQEFKILNLFLKNPDCIYTREQILDTVWGRDVFLTPRTVDTHVSSLRKKLHNLSVSVSILTIRGDGYKCEIKKAG